MDKKGFAFISCCPVCPFVPSQPWPRPQTVGKANAPEALCTVVRFTFLHHSHSLLQISLNAAGKCSHCMFHKAVDWVHYIHKIQLL